MREGVILSIVLLFSILFAGCVTTSQEAYNLKRAEIEEKCRIQLGWDDPICKYLDDEAVESLGGGDTWQR